MKLLTKRDQIQSVVVRWTEQYKNFPPDYWAYETLKKLKQLNFNTCSATDVDIIIGNGSWTTIRCSECQIRVDAVVIFNDGHLCKKCIEEAQLLFNEGKNNFLESGN